MKRRFWSFILCLECLLAGAWFLRSAVLGNEEGNWQIKGISMLAAGGILILFGIFVGLSRQVNIPVNPEKLEAFSRYLVQSPLWCLLSLLVVELMLRALVYNPPLHRDVTNWAGDIPGVHSIILWGKEGYAITEYDKWGALKTPFHDKKKDNNVIVLGDSQTECLQVADSLKFVSVAETFLRRDGYDADLHNLGRSGLAMADYISWIPPYRAVFRPKVIVVQLVMSDFIESFQEGQFNYFVAGNDHELGLVHVYDLSGGLIQKARRKYYINSQIKEQGDQRWYFMREMIEDSLANETRDTATGGNISTETVNLPTSSAQPAQSQPLDMGAFDSVFADQQMKLLLDASEGVPLIVVLLPTAPYISGNEIEMTDPTHEQLKGFIARYPEVILVDPLPEFRALVSTGHLPRGFFNSAPGTGHLNEYGNEIVGELLAKAIGQVLK